MDGKDVKTLLNKLYSVADDLEPLMNNKVISLKFYEAMAIYGLVSFLNSDRINYFEIYSAFEKMGVFDSTWQKSVKTSLINIDKNLSEINSNLKNLNSQFAEFIHSQEKLGEKIVDGLKDIDSSINVNNVINSVTAFKTVIK